MEAILVVLVLIGAVFGLGIGYIAAKITDTKEQPVPLSEGVPNTTPDVEETQKYLKTKLRELNLQVEAAETILNRYKQEQSILKRQLKELK